MLAVTDQVPESDANPEMGSCRSRVLMQEELGKKREVTLNPLGVLCTASIQPCERRWTKDASIC